MRLIAKKPCSFGGRQFYIGDEIPENLVTDARVQEKMGVITIVNDGTGGPGEQSGPLFTQEQTDRMIAEAVNSALLEMEKKQGTLPPETGILMEAEGTGVFEGTIPIAVMEEESGEAVQGMAVPTTPEEIRKVFSKVAFYFRQEAGHAGAQEGRGVWKYGFRILCAAEQGILKMC